MGGYHARRFAGPRNSIYKGSPMKTRGIGVLLFCLTATALTCLSTISLAQIATFSSNEQFLGKCSVISFDFPGAVNTQATAITPSGDIVGRYTGGDGIQHGFQLTGGKLRSITFPGATLTDVNWINPRGQIVGGYIGSTGNEHGFLLSGGKFTTIDYP